MDIVIVLGGDGTVHECVNGLAPLDRRPILSILPAGTCNDFAQALMIPLNMKQAAELILWFCVWSKVIFPIATLSVPIICDNVSSTSFCPALPL